MARRDYAGNAVPTTITSGISATDLSITIADATGWPGGGASGEFFVTIDRGLSNEERVLVASRTGTTLTVAAVGKRGVDDTVAAIHGANAVIEHTFSGVDADEANAHLNDTSRDDHTQYHNNARHDVEARHQFGAALGTPGAPAAIGTVPSAGTGDDPAREDHVHEIGPGAIDSTAMFADQVITSAKIADGTIVAGDLAADAVTNGKILDGAVTGAKINDGAVSTVKVEDDAITAPKIADAAIDNTAKILNGIITQGKIAEEDPYTYVPTFGGLTGASNTVFGQYFKFGQLVVGWAGFTIGPGGNINDDITVSLPTQALVGSGRYLFAARCLIGTTRASGAGVIEGGATEGGFISTFGSDPWDADSPANWTDNDNMLCVFAYPSET